MKRGIERRSTVPLETNLNLECGGWIVCQIGAREHFSIARALYRVGVPVTLVTDYWHDAPFAWPFSPRLSQRRHAEVPRTAVRAFNARCLLNELVSKLQGANGWGRILARNRWFGQLAAQAVRRAARCNSPPSIVFSYSYAAEEIFESAKRFGSRTILGQIDPGPAETRIVAELHEKAGLPFLDEPPPAYWRQWRRECELADIVMVNSNWSAQGLLNEGIPEGKIRVVPLVYATDCPAPARDLLIPESFGTNRPLRVLFLGQVIARKGILELCEAARKLAGKPIEWTIVGHGDHRLLDQLRGLAQVRVVGPVSRDTAAEYYRQSDVFLLPTHSDGYAITQLEAASFGLPIIASRHCGDVVRDGVDGLLLNEVTGASIAAAIMTYVTSPKVLARHAQARRETPLSTLDELGWRLARLGNSLCEPSSEKLEWTGNN